MKPSRKEVEHAIKTAQLWTEERQDTDGVMLSVKMLRDLTTAARWALELVDDDNPPLLPEDMERMKPKDVMKLLADTPPPGTKPRAKK